jgi:hypothetical protein
MTIKIVLLCSILGMVSGRTFAQNSDNIDYIKKVEKYRRIKIAGTTLTALGSVLFVVGTITIYNSSAEDLFYTESKSTDAGVACFFAGNIALAGGIPLWIIGANNQNKYSKLAQQVNVRINASPKQSTLSLTYRF